MSNNNLPAIYVLRESDLLAAATFCVDAANNTSMNANAIVTTLTLFIWTSRVKFNAAEKVGSAWCESDWGTVINVSPFQQTYYYQAN